jgi:hypothetical protein
MVYNNLINKFLIDLEAIDLFKECKHVNLNYLFLFVLKTNLFKLTNKKITNNIFNI